jgi:hypothetical protein
MVWDKEKLETLRANLTELDRQIIGGHKRVSIPMAIPRQAFAEIGEAIAEYATQMRMQARMENATDRDVNLRMGHETAHLNNNIRQICNRWGITLRDGGASHVRFLEKQGQNKNTTATEESVTLANPLTLVRGGGQ